MDREAEWATVHRIERVRHDWNYLACIRAWILLVTVICFSFLTCKEIIDWFNFLYNFFFIILQILAIHSRMICLKSDLNIHVCGISCWVVSNSFATPRTVASQASLSMGFPWQEFWSRFPFPSLGDLPDVRTEPMSPALASKFFTTEPPGRPHIYIVLNVVKEGILTWWEARKLPIWRCCVVT